MDNNTKSRFEGIKEASDQIIVSLLGAFVLLIAFDTWINDFIAMPLRVVSTSISEIIVAMFGYDVIREGTSLVVGTFRFNVDTACSGSQTMQQMLATAIILVGVWGGMSLGQKVVAVLLALPLAIFVNGLRVSALMLASLRAGKGLPEDTFEHQFIGVVAFSLAIIIFWQICKQVSKTTLFNRGTVVIEVILVSLLIGVIFFPFMYNTVISWFGSEWNPNNKYAGVFPVIAVTLFVIFGYTDIMRAAMCGRRKGGGGTIGLILFTLGLCWAVVATKLGFASVQGLGFVAVIFGMMLMAFRVKIALYGLPLIGIMILGFGRIPLIVNELFSTQGEYGWSVLFIGRGLATLFLASAYIYFQIKKSATKDLYVDAKGNSWQVVYVLLLLIVGGGLLWQGQANSSSEGAIQGHEEITLLVDMPLNLGVWQGEEYPLSENTKELLGGTGASLKVYTSDYALPIEFFYNFSGGNRHNLHPPEYCLTGAGWKIVEKKSLRMVAQNGGEFPITVMRLKNGEDVRWFAFWFYDGVSIEASYMRMLGEDLFSRLGGVKREWSIYRVIALREVDLIKFVEEISRLVK